ncbi:hypothetical protein AQI95_26915 [Streptomyces yokosukanensis]|uniref:Uncharacterized protein n=1 Tax=Streptomyces yokosukanensis TaxID=67386 RepID=A0A101P0C8_9ACTN|nr:hypothetical protein AQI95_26915 [Streptomyces yokosukanensis]
MLCTVFGKRFSGAECAQECQHEIGGFPVPGSQGEIDVELPIQVDVCDEPGETQCDGALSDPGWTGDHNCWPAATIWPLQQPSPLVDLRLAPEQRAQLSRKARNCLHTGQRMAGFDLLDVLVQACKDIAGQYGVGVGVPNVLVVVQ